jgi:RimJ/RimL family protein N-acetyltransferase
LVDGSTALRSWRDKDAVRLVAVCQDPEIPRWTRVPTPYGESDARAFLLQRYDAVSAETLAPFAIVPPAADGELLGSIALMHPDWTERRAEVGYWLARDARGHGHATRAVRLICEWGFAALSLEKVELFAATGNPASQRVADRAGFTREALMRAYYVGRDGPEDMVMYGLLSGEL